MLSKSTLLNKDNSSINVQCSKVTHHTDCVLMWHPSSKRHILDIDLPTVCTVGGVRTNTSGFIGELKTTTNNVLFSNIYGFFLRNTEESNIVD